jgi:hypothetical protein
MHWVTRADGSADQLFNDLAGHIDEPAGPVGSIYPDFIDEHISPGYYSGVTSRTYSAFLDGACIAQGALPDIAHACAAALQRDGQRAPLVFDDADGRTVELDLRGTPAQAAARVAHLPSPTPAPTPAPVRTRGRPQLGVIAREVTLLPRHWDWLALQPGGASVALRKLIEEARKAGGKGDARRAAQERAYRFLSIAAGNLPDYEEALRALFAASREGFEEHTAAWPQDIRNYALFLSQGAFES